MPASNEQTESDAKVGLIAAWGEYPLLLARAYRREGYRVYCLGVAGHASSQLAEECDNFRWIGLCKLGGAIRYFHRHGVTKATMAGKVHKGVFYQPWVWWRHLPDWRAFRTFFPYFVLKRNDCKDDTLTNALIEQFARENIRFLTPTDIAPELLVKYGKLSRRGPSRLQARDIEFGWKLAKDIGRQDIGQCVTVKNRAPLAIEAIEGTDACIRRTKELCPSGGFTVVKVAKPQQDMRFDVPTIGRGTLESMVHAGASVLAVEAEKTIIINEAEVVAYANQHNIIVVALQKDGQCQFDDNATHAA